MKWKFDILAKRGFGTENTVNDRNSCIKLNAL